MLVPGRRSVPITKPEQDERGDGQRREVDRAVLPQLAPHRPVAALPPVRDAARRCVARRVAGSVEVAFD